MELIFVTRNVTGVFVDDQGREISSFQLSIIGSTASIYSLMGQGFFNLIKTNLHELYFKFRIKKVNFYMKTAVMVAFKKMANIPFEITGQENIDGNDFTYMVVDIEQILKERKAI